MRRDQCAADLASIMPGLSFREKLHIGGFEAAAALRNQRWLLPEEFLPKPLRMVLVEQRIRRAGTFCIESMDSKGFSKSSKSEYLAGHDARELHPDVKVSLDQLRAGVLDIGTACPRREALSLEVLSTPLLVDIGFKECAGSQEPRPHTHLVSSR